VITCPLHQARDTVSVTHQSSSTHTFSYSSILAATQQFPAQKFLRESTYGRRNFFSAHHETAIQNLKLQA
jgi:hypothetical protein